MCTKAVSLAVIISVGLLAGCRLEAGSSATPPAARAEKGFSYDGWNLALQRVDDHGLVDYAALVADPSGLRAYYAAVANLAPDTYAGWDDSEKIALWINTYNALTVLAIVEHWPLQRSGLASLAHPRGIRWIPGVWDKLEWTVLGRTITLDGIEHQTLREEFAEPRIHAALVCGARSCPPLRNEPYEGARLDQQLEDQMRRFANNPQTGLRIDQAAGRVSLSRIFDWYGDDFVASYLPASGYGAHSDKQRATLAATAAYRSAADRAFLEQGNYSVDLLDYDWSLNEQPPSHTR